MLQCITDLFNANLEGRVHETRVAQVTEATQARLRLRVPVVVGGAVGIGATQPVWREEPLVGWLVDTLHF